MIIKKRKNPDNNNNNDNEKDNFLNFTEEKKPNSGILESLSEITEREERRRGDRRRGYRRIEDRSLVSRAHEEAKIIKEQAATDGFQHGIAQAKEEIQKLQEVITDLIGIKETAYEKYTNDIAQIAIQVAQKILNAHVQVAPETIVEIVKNVIKEISEEESRITFIINPEDELILKSNLETNSAFNNKKATMLVQVDDRIEKGSCKVITTSGQIDATFASQISIIKRAFEEGM